MLPRGKLHAVFIDYMKIFVLFNRTFIITGKNHVTRLLINILTSNFIKIDDTITTSEPIEQINGVLQGDLVSPILFIKLTHEEVKMFIYLCL